MSIGFDFVVKAEKVIIKEKGDNNYKVKLAGLSDFLKYQVWSNTNTNNINGDRSVFLLRAKDWVEQFKIVNSNNSNNSIHFTPTTVIEIDNKKYVTVITNAEFKNKKVIFHMSTDDVKFNSKKMKKMNKLPKGEFYNVRFDIDDGGGVNSYCVDSCSGNAVVGATCSQQCSGATNCFNAFETTYPDVLGSDGYPGIILDLNNFCTDINKINKYSSSDAYTTIGKKDIPAWIL